MLFSAYMTAGSPSIGGHFHGYLGGEENMWQHLLSSVPFIATYDAGLKVNLYLQTFGFTELIPFILSARFRVLETNHLHTPAGGNFLKENGSIITWAEPGGTGVPMVATLGDVHDEMSIRYLHQLDGGEKNCSGVYYIARDICGFGFPNHFQPKLLWKIISRGITMPFVLEKTTGYH